jgi:hypothetical protein
MSSGPFAAAIENYQHSLKVLGMDDSGMFTAELNCLRCGKVLNADGNHPAEVYAGTCTGLCYGCTKEGTYVTEVAVLDGALRVSWPPHLPSWRRDRESYYAYAGCETCGGQGVEQNTSDGRIARSSGCWGVQCRACLDRYVNHPARALDQDYRAMLYRSAQAAAQRLMLRSAGLPARCSAKRQQAAWTALSLADRDAIRDQVRPRAVSLMARHVRRIERLGVGVWREPKPEEVLSA